VVESFPTLILSVFFVSLRLRGGFWYQESQSRTDRTDPHPQKVRPLVHRQGKKTTNLFPHRALVFPVKKIQRFSI
jgi:hypothetical protein